MSTPAVMATSARLVAAIGEATASWARVCLDFDNVAAWCAHERAQAKVREARQEHTRARVAARCEAQLAGRGR